MDKEEESKMSELLGELMFLSIRNRVEGDPGTRELDEIIEKYKEYYNPPKE